MDVELPSGAQAIGKRISEIKLPEDCLVVSVRQGRKLRVAHGNTVLGEHDRLTVFASQACAPRFSIYSPPVRLSRMVRRTLNSRHTISRFLTVPHPSPQTERFGDGLISSSRTASMQIEEAGKICLPDIFYIPMDGTGEIFWASRSCLCQGVW